MRKIVNYWAEILVFGIILGILMVDLNPDYTFINKAADSIGYAYSAKYLYPSFHSSPPLYLLISHLFLQIPYGTDAWRMSLISVLSTVGACVFIYLILRKLLGDKKYARYFALLGVLIYGTSALVISQSIVIETYALVCLFAVAAYYFALTKHWKLMALMLGLNLVVHLLAFFVAFIMVCGFRDFRKKWTSWAIMAGCLVFYLYIPITNRAPYMWLPDPQMVNSNVPHILVSIYSFITDTASTVGFLIGKLSVYDIPKRVLDIIGIVGVAVGVITVIPIAYYFWKTKYYTQVLFWLIMTPIIIFLVELDMNTYDYTMLSIPFLAIVAVLGLVKLVEKYGQYAKYFAYATAVVIVGFAGYNANYFDIGRTLDKDLSASRMFYEEFAKLPDNAIFMPTYTPIWEAIYQYNRDYHKNIYPLNMDMLPSQGYRDQLAKDGIKLRVGTDENLSILAMQTAESIVELNDNVWTTVWTDPSTFGAKVVPANHDTKLVAIYDIGLIHSTAENPQWHWKPYAPYSVLTTEITVEQWNYVLLSNHNIAFVVFLGALGYGIVAFIYLLMKQRRNAKKNAVQQ